MVLTAHQPGYLPWLGLFHKIAMADVYVVYDHVQYKPQHTDNRNRVKTHDGPVMLTVPCDRAQHYETAIKDVKIQEGNWRRKHRRTLELAYGKAPFWEDYKGFVESCYGRPWDRLITLNIMQLKYFLGALGLGPKLFRSSELGITAHKHQGVLDMCRALDVDAYIFGANGREYMGPEELGMFRDAGVEVVFQDYQHPVYPQMHGDFVPYMSVLDLLMNEGRDSLATIMRGNASCVNEMGRP